MVEARNVTPLRKRPDTLFVSSVEKGFAVLYAFRTGQRELGLRDLSLSQISEISGLDKSASQRFTNTLVKLGYLEKDQRTRRYRPALGNRDLAADCRQQGLWDHGEPLCPAWAECRLYRAYSPGEYAISSHVDRTQNPHVFHFRRDCDAGKAE